MRLGPNHHAVRLQNPILEVVVVKEHSPCSLHKSELSEAELRRRDADRAGKLRGGDLDYDEFRASLRSVSKNR